MLSKAAKQILIWAEYSAAFALLVAGVWMLVRATAGRKPSGEAARPGSGEPAAYSPEE